ncbi:MAG: tyrosine-type recombinase/integrase [Deltaproteobacteria bacterium]|nr:tyrosine-type recombinase/integrase [Deltaproteobacteria bacterium]
MSSGPPRCSVFIVGSFGGSTTPCSHQVVPSAIEQIRRVLAIPAQRTDTTLVPYLTPEETKALLDTPDPTTRLGIRDRAMFYLGTAGGLRVSELVGVRVSEVTFDGRYLELRIQGKGRRQRALVLWKDVADAVRAWLAIRGQRHL